MRISQLIGAVVYSLRAEKKTSLVPFHGRLLHGALFRMLGEINQEIAEALHEETGAKNFSAGLLEPDIKEKSEKELRLIPGRFYRWRVCALNEMMLKMLLSIPKESFLEVGRGRLSFVETIADGNFDSGVVEEQMLVGGALSLVGARSLTFRFLTPGTFRRDDMDYPLPTPELVFGSLARKWTENRMPLEIDEAAVREVAWHMKPFKWEGRSVFGYMSKGRGITGFQGMFTYSLEGLSEEWRQIFMMLGQYASFAGVGRLTGQGFGRVQFSWS